MTLTEVTINILTTTLVPHPLHMNTDQSTNTDIPDTPTNIFTFWQEPPDIAKNSKSSIWVERKDFYCFSEHPTHVVAGSAQPELTYPLLLILLI